MSEFFHKAAARKLGALALVALSFSLYGCEPSTRDRFPDPWVETRSAPIDRVLTDHNVRGCETMVYRPSEMSNGPLDPRGEFLVYCSPDGTTWTAYIAVPGLARERNLTGPLAVYADLPPP
jgi:hypothetical protein